MGKSEVIPFRIVYQKGKEFVLNGGGNIEYYGRKWKVTSIKSVKSVRNGVEVVGACKEIKNPSEGNQRVKTKQN